jgi:PAS domain S-box-containing protein/putative nucleotidyltransferase with HDIG domain
MNLIKNSAEELLLRYTRLFETAQDGILLLSFPEGLIEDANPYLTNLIGYSKSELLGKQLWEIGLLVDKNKALAAHAAIVSNGYVRYEDIDLLHKNGQRLPVEFICNSYDVNGSTVVQCNIRDISERKIAESLFLKEQAKNISQLKDTISSFSNLIEARDPFTAGHQKRVADLACAIATELHLEPSEIEGLRIACLIHDIGKISIPSEILTKPTTLSRIEIAMLRSHVQIGYDIIKPLRFPWPIADYILQHHERLDGSGYPNSLKAEQISLPAKIIAVADTVEAMSSDRPYRSAEGLTTALDEILMHRDTLFDRKVVDACLNLFKNKSYSFPSANSANYMGSQVGGFRSEAAVKQTS